MTPLLLDTNAAIWITQDLPLADTATKALAEAAAEGATGFCLSDHRLGSGIARRSGPDRTSDESGYMVRAAA